MAKKKPKPVDPEWGICNVCGSLSAWAGYNVGCDGFNEKDGIECDGVYIPSDENGKPL